MYHSNHACYQVTRQKLKNSRKANMYTVRMSSAPIIVLGHASTEKNMFNNNDLGQL